MGKCVGVGLEVGGGRGEKEGEKHNLTPVRYSVTTTMTLHQGGEPCEPFYYVINCEGKVTRQCQ